MTYPEPTRVVQSTYRPDIRLRSLIDNLGDEAPLRTLGVMAYTRQCLEQDGVTADFPVLYMYCNWCFHVGLSRSETLLDMLDQLNHLLEPDNSVALFQQITPATLHAAFERILGILKLRVELIRCLSERRISTAGFVSDVRWHAFMLSLLNEIQGRVIEYAAGKQFEAAKAATLKAQRSLDLMVVSFGVFPAADPTGRFTYDWSIGIYKGVIVTGPFV